MYRPWFRKPKLATLARAAVGTLVFAIMVLTSTGPASADQDPAGCDASGLGLSFQVFRADGTTAIGGGNTVEDGELIKYRATLSALGAPNCAFEGGTWQITDPGGVITNLGAVPRIGGTGVSSVTSALISYTVDHGDESVLQQILASVSYSGGTSHDSVNDTLGVVAANSGLTRTVVHPDVHVAKTAADTPISAGETATFTITTSNAGPGTAFNVVMTDTLPGTGWAENPDNLNCAIVAAANDLLTCTYASLAEGASDAVTVERATTTADCGTLPNTANVSADNEDPADTGDNSASDFIVVDCPDVHVAKTATNTPISAGQTASFTITTSNAGPGTAFNVVMTDTLPGTGWVENPDNPNCAIVAAANDLLTCTYASLAEGASDAVTVESHHHG